MDSVTRIVGHCALLLWPKQWYANWFHIFVILRQKAKIFENTRVNPVYWWSAICFNTHAIFECVIERKRKDVGIRYVNSILFSPSSVTHPQANTSRYRSLSYELAWVTSCAGKVTQRLADRYGNAQFVYKFPNLNHSCPCFYQLLKGQRSQEKFLKKYLL